MQNITPFLWFDDQAEEAAHFYISIFPNSKMRKISRYGDNMPMPKGTVLVAEFELNGQIFNALNGGPALTFSPAISFVINCETQEEVDHFWGKLSAKSAAEQCGWLQDKYGLSWQVVPTILNKLMNDPDPIKANRVAMAMIQMKKLVIADLQKAYEQQ